MRIAGMALPANNAPTTSANIALKQRQTDDPGCVLDREHSRAGHMACLADFCVPGSSPD
jgi:hypothetical protein